MPNKIVTLPSGQQVCLVPREQLRVKGPHKKVKAPDPGFCSFGAEPVAPPSWDFSKGESLKYPILGNDRFGDCYYVAICNGSKTFTGNTGTEFDPDVNAVTARYQQLSGGDNGLDDSLAMPEWLQGVVGPNGPRKILDWMVVPQATDYKVAEFMFWFSGGRIWTCSLLDTWLNNANPGSVWDSNGRPDPNAGHAMFQTGMLDNHHRQTRTWGISPPIQVTPAGERVADSEFIVVVSADQFDPKTGRNFASGLSWEDHKAVWMAHGGKDFGPSPFPDPTPPVPVPPGPTPPVPPGPTPPTPWGGLLILLQEFLAWLMGQLGDPNSRSSQQIAKLTPGQWLALIMQLLQLLGPLFGKSELAPDDKSNSPTGNSC